MWQAIELTSVRDQIIEAKRAKLMSAPEDASSAVRTDACLNALSLCRGLNSYEEFEQCILGCHKAAETATAEDQAALHLHIASQVQHTYQTLKFWVMIHNVRTCPC
jgi:hypothetical protein